MASTLTLFDETTAGDLRTAVTLHLPAPTITARELIRARVFEEVKAYNEKLPETFAALVQPTGAVRDPDGFRMEPRKLDWHEQSRIALEAFERNGFVLLVDDRQIEELEEEIRVRPETRVTFLRLIPLMGG